MVRMQAQSVSAIMRLTISAPRARFRAWKALCRMASMIGRASKVVMSMCSTVLLSKAALSLAVFFSGVCITFAPAAW